MIHTLVLVEKFKKITFFNVLKIKFIVIFSVSIVHRVNILARFLKQIWIAAL